MTDIRSSEKRRHIMQSVRSKNTAPEIAIRKLLHAMGYRFRLHRKDLPGTPDIVFPRRKKIVFVHGCFWHGHNCKTGKLPKSRLEYWMPKIARNRERDEGKTAQLEQLGWEVLAIWQCELKDLEKLKTRLIAFLDH